MAKAKDVYAKIQKDLSDAQKKRQSLDLRVKDLQVGIAARDKQIATMMSGILPWAEKLSPAMFAEKRRLEAEAIQSIEAYDQSVRSLTDAYDKATKLYSDLYTAHADFERAETNRMLINLDYVAGINAISAYSESETRACLDELTAQSERSDKRLRANWLIRAAYYNNFGQDGYVSQHFIQDLFGMLCQKVKKTKRYNRLTKDVEFSNEALSSARADAYRKAAAASSATILVEQMREATRSSIERHAQESLHQRAVVDAAASTLDREANARKKEKARNDALKDWSHPVAKEAKDRFEKILTEDSANGAKMRTDLSEVSTVASMVRNLMREIAHRSEELLTLSALIDQRKLLTNTIDKLESTSRDMRRKSLSSSSREISKADDFMAGNSMDSSFDLSTLVAVALVMDAVIDATPQDTSVSFSSDSYSSASFE